MSEIAGMLVSALGQGFIYAPMALGVFLTFSILKTPDLTVEGSFVFGMTSCVIISIAAGFVNEMEAREYASFLENCNRMAGYNGSRFSIEYGCPVSEAQEEYDIWKAQFPKNLERTEIRHN